jgi:hypothetical protein
MLYKATFNDNSHRNGLLNQSNPVQLYLPRESSLKIILRNISVNKELNHLTFMTQSETIASIGGEGEVVYSFIIYLKHFSS